MTEKVYLLQSVEENFWWKKTLSALGVATCDFNPSLKQTVLMNSVGKRLLFADRRQLLHEISESNPCIQQWISHGGSIVVTGPESSEKFVYTFTV